jgi:hypothetical protein
MSEKEFEELMETRWRRELTSQERAALQIYFSTHPHAQVAWNQESGLSHLLEKLPDVPLSTNFTSLVMQAVEREGMKTKQSASPVLHWLKFNWLSRAAVAGLIVCASLFSVQQYRAAKRTEIAQNVVAISTAATVPQEWLQNFDAINRLGQPPVDNELLAALQ